MLFWVAITLDLLVLLPADLQAMSTQKPESGACLSDVLCSVTSVSLHDAIVEQTPTAPQKWNPPQVWTLSAQLLSAVLPLQTQSHCSLHTMLGLFSRQRPSRGPPFHAFA